MDFNLLIYILLTVHPIIMIVFFFTKLMLGPELLIMSVFLNL